MGQLQVIMALVFIGLFSIALLTFATNFAIDNDASVNILDDPELSTLNTQLTGNVSAFSSDAEDQYSSIVETQLEGDVAPSVGPFAITPTNSKNVVESILRVGYSKVFGTEEGADIFFTTFIAMIVFMLGLFIYKTLRGIPD